MKTLALALLLIAVCESSRVRYDDQQALSVCNCRRGSSKYNSICGSNGESYPGWCWFDCARSKNPSLRAVDRVFCPMAKKRWIDCFCPLIYYPVCASNGQTYPNDCQLGCAQFDDPDLTLVYYGKC